MEGKKAYSSIRCKRRWNGKTLSAMLTIPLLFAMMVANLEALSLPTKPSRRESVHRCREAVTYNHSRRDFMEMTCALIVPLLSDPAQANAAQDTADAKERFVAARKELRDLIDNYSEITAKGGGDAVRNRLGTQGINSSLFGIQKVLKTLTADAEDLVEYTETMEEFNAYYFQAEGAAYQSMFVEHSSAKGTPETFLKTAKDDILQMEKYMNQLAIQLNL